VGTMWLIHEGIKVQVEWEGGPMELDRFNRVLHAVTETWSAASGKVSRLVPASALTYNADA
jgi:hypothetical protein